MHAPNSIASTPTPTPGKPLPPSRQRALGARELQRLTLEMSLLNNTLVPKSTTTATTTALGVITNGTITWLRQANAGTTLPPTPPPENRNNKNNNDKNKNNIGNNGSLVRANVGGRPAPKTGPVYNFSALTARANGQGGCYDSSQSSYTISSNPPDPRTVVRQGDWW